jgi:ABC-type multidrug transport system ATPase subunit
MRFRLENVSYKYPRSSKNALNNLSVSFDSSSTIGLIGENGSGKSTLIKVLLRQLISIDGDYYIDDKKVIDIHGNILSDFRLGYLPEEIFLDDDLTGREIIEIVADLRGVPAQEFTKELTFFSEQLRIGPWLGNKKCSEYSQGMRKKLGLFIAFLGDRRFVILDEPTNALDVLSVLGLKKIIRDKISSGIGVLVSSHSIDFVNSVAEHVIVIREGEIQFSGEISDLKKHSPETSNVDEVYLKLLGQE